ncbi:MAG: hypothetical protein COB53_11415 [Elusimicrobia bacterium]|nr:MAG: hypothetical protein COB53_11415 [Elusimicrobiota bacterium]
MAVKKNRTAQSRRAVLDNSFDAVSLDLRDSLRDPSVRGKVRSKLRRNWFAKGEWYSPQPRRPYEMPALTMADQNLGVLTRMNVSLQTALAPWKRLLNAASQSSWSSVAIVRTLAG